MDEWNLAYYTYIYWRVIVLSGLKTAVTVTRIGAIRTKDESYSGR